MDCGLTGLTFKRPSLTEAQFNDECDISNIVHRFLRTGQLPSFADRPVIEDASNLPTDYFELQSAILKANSIFEKLPLEERNKFHNNPEEYFTALSKPDEVKPDEVKPDEPKPDESKSDGPKPDDTAVA